MIYQILIKETLERVVSVEAKNATDAIGKVEEDYNRSDIVLGADDFSSVEIEFF